MAPVSCGNDPTCEETQTCHGNTGSDDGTGGDGTRGGGAGTSSNGADGGSDGGGDGAGASSASGGASGSSNGGGAGSNNGGSGGEVDETPPTIESFSPPDAEVDVEPVVEISVTFSEAIDATTATTESVTLVGPRGEVSGSPSVDGNVLTFTPDRRLDLLGTYTLSIARSIADLAGNTLVRGANTGFQVRDGRFSAPTYPFGRILPRNVTRFQHNGSGDVVVGMEQPEDHTAVYGAVYHAAEDRWTTPFTLHSMGGVEYHASGLDIDPARRAVVAWGGIGTAGYGWARFTDDERWIDSGPLYAYAEVTASSEGAATAVSWEGADPDLVIHAQDLVTGTIDPPAPYPTLDSAEFVFPVASLGRMALISAEDVSGGQELTVRWQSGVGWAAPESLTRVSYFASFTWDSDEQGNILVVWREDDEISSRFYDHAGNRWLPVDFLGSVPSNVVLGKPDLTAGNAILYFKTPDPDAVGWVAVYEAGVGWIEDSVVELSGGTPGPFVGVSMDAAGNALVVWDTNFRHRRYLHGLGWQPASSLVSISISRNYVWGAAAPDGSVLVMGNDFASPLAIRFE